MADVRAFVRPIAGIAGFVAIAEAVARTGLVDSDLLPPISSVLARAAGLIGDTEFWGEVGATLTAWAVGMLVTIVIAIPLGVLLGTVRPAETAARPLMEFLRPIPSVALVPLVLVLAGDDFVMKVIVIAYASSWPVLINTMYGVREVDPLAKETLRSFGFGRLSVLARVAVPSAAPFIVTGIRLASSVGLILAVSAELLAGGTHGIGVFITNASGGGDTMDLVLAAAMWAGVIGLVVNAAIVAVERRAFFWHTERTRGRP